MGTSNFSSLYVVAKITFNIHTILYIYIYIAVYSWYIFDIGVPISNTPMELSRDYSTEIRFRHVF